MTQVRALVDGKVVVFEDEAQYDAWLLEEARRRYPERYAPNGEELRNYWGSSWGERIAAWQHAQGRAETRASSDEEPEIPASSTELEVSDRDVDQPYGRVRGEA